jgi:hypothetical protein
MIDCRGTNAARTDTRFFLVASQSDLWCKEEKPVIQASAGKAGSWWWLGVQLFVDTAVMRGL